MWAEILWNPAFLFLCVLHIMKLLFSLIKCTCGASREKKTPYDDVYEVQLSLPFYLNWFSSAFKYTFLMCWILMKSFDFIIIFLSL